MITLSVQYAHQDVVVEERGAVDVLQAIESFRAFPWDEQLAEAKELQSVHHRSFSKTVRMNRCFLPRFFSPTK